MRIAFAGKRASGKSTLAEYLHERYRFDRLAFADPIKAIIRDAPTQDYARQSFLWDWAKALWPEDERRPNLDTIRARFVSQVAGALRIERDRGKLAQKIGTDIGRALDQNVWLRYLVRRLPHAGPDISVEDVRFPNEITALREAGFVVIRLDCPEDVLAERIKRRGDDVRDGSHESETSLPPYPDAYDDVWPTDEPLAVTIDRLDRLVAELRAASTPSGTPKAPV